MDPVDLNNLGHNCRSRSSLLNYGQEASSCWLDERRVVAILYFPTKGLGLVGSQISTNHKIICDQSETDVLCREQFQHDK